MRTEPQLQSVQVRADNNFVSLDYSACIASRHLRNSLTYLLTYSTSTLFSLLLFFRPLWPLSGSTAIPCLTVAGAVQCAALNSVLGCNGKSTCSDYLKIQMIVSHPKVNH